MNEEIQKKVEEWKEDLKVLKEVDFFLLIDCLEYVLYSKHDYPDLRFEMFEDIFDRNPEYCDAVLQECYSMLTNFGVDPASVHDLEQGSYRKWHQFWSSWKESLSDEAWEEFLFLQLEEESYEHLLPKTKWNDLPAPEENSDQQAIEDSIADYQKKLKEFLQLPDDYDALSDLKNNGWSEEEIGIIVNHFLEGGMLSEIIAPARGAGSNESIIGSSDALMRFDRFFYQEVDKTPGLKDRLIETWAKKKV